MGYSGHHLVWSTVLEDLDRDMAEVSTFSFFPLLNSTISITWTDMVDHELDDLQVEPVPAVMDCFAGSVRRDYGPNPGIMC